MVAGISPLRASAAPTGGGPGRFPLIGFTKPFATLEGGLSWLLHARLMQDHLVAVFCKDFFWEKIPGGQKARWCPLGEGAVQKSFFDWLKTTNFTGPISQHHEYDGLGTGAEMVKHLQRDLVQLRTWLAG